MCEQKKEVFNPTVYKPEHIDEIPEWEDYLDEEGEDGENDEYQDYDFDDPDYYNTNS